MAEEPITIKFTRDQALVLSDWLYQATYQSDVLDDLLKTDRAVWSPIYTISGALEATLAEIFMPDYDERLKAARQRLLVEMYGSDEEAGTGGQRSETGLSGRPCSWNDLGVARGDLTDKQRERLEPLLPPVPRMGRPPRGHVRWSGVSTATR
ncbi:hypothetical protein ACFQ0M_16650 [Kitasatospora aburaviensis]